MAENYRTVIATPLEVQPTLQRVAGEGFKLHTALALNDTGRDDGIPKGAVMLIFVQEAGSDGKRTMTSSTRTTPFWERSPNR